MRAVARLPAASRTLTIAIARRPARLRRTRRALRAVSRSRTRREPPAGIRNRPRARTTRRRLPRKCTRVRVRRTTRPRHGGDCSARGQRSRIRATPRRPRRSRPLAIPTRTVESAGPPAGGGAPPPGGAGPATGPPLEAERREVDGAGDRCPARRHQAAVVLADDDHPVGLVLDVLDEVVRQDGRVHRDEAGSPSEDGVERSARRQPRDARAPVGWVVGVADDHHPPARVQRRREAEVALLESGLPDLRRSAQAPRGDGRSRVT